MKLRNGKRLRFIKEGQECFTTEWVSTTPITSREGIYFYILISVSRFDVEPEEPEEDTRFYVEVHAVPILTEEDWKTTVDEHYLHYDRRGAAAAAVTYEDCGGRCFLILSNASPFRKVEEALMCAYTLEDVEHRLQIMMDNSYHEYLGEPIHCAIGLTPVHKLQAFLQENDYSEVEKLIESFGKKQMAADVLTEEYA